MFTKIFLRNFQLLAILLWFNAFTIKGDPLFNSHEVIHFELRSDFGNLLSNRTEDPEYQDATLVLLSHHDGPDAFEIKIRPRGNFRRNPENCNFPPLFVNFRKSEVKGTLFDDIDEIKLVTPCQSEEDVVEEYLIYRMYNEVTDTSLKVRLARIKYIDTQTGSLMFERYSFFIEPKENLEKRLKGSEYDNMLTPYALDPDNFMKLSMFQYMIGNKDWFITTRQNMILIKPDNPDQNFIAVPYDFDFAGLIDADYTRPKGVKADKLASRRVYKGICFTEEEYEKAFDFFLRLRPDFRKIIAESEYLSRTSKHLLVSYINEFYSVIRYRKYATGYFMSKCETRKLYNLPD